MSREERHQLLLRYLTEDPLQTDEVLADRLGVSVPTVRLDRLTLGVPALHRRSQQLAQRVVGNSPSRATITAPGELLALERGVMAQGQWVVGEEMATAIGGGIPVYLLLAHAERLIYGIAGGEIVLIGLVNAKCYRPVRAGEQLESSARVIRRKGGRVVTLIEMSCGRQPVFRAKYVFYAVDFDRTPIT